MTFAKAFVLVEQCDHVLCQYNVIGLMSLLVDSRKSLKTPIATVELAKTKGDKTLYCWSCGQLAILKRIVF